MGFVQERLARSTPVGVSSLCGDGNTVVIARHVPKPFVQCPLPVNRGVVHFVFAPLCICSGILLLLTLVLAAMKMTLMTRSMQSL